MRDSLARSGLRLSEKSTSAYTKDASGRAKNRIRSLEPLSRAEQTQPRADATQQYIGFYSLPQVDMPGTFPTTETPFVRMKLFWLVQTVSAFRICKRTCNRLARDSASALRYDKMPRSPFSQPLHSFIGHCRLACFLTVNDPATKRSR